MLLSRVMITGASSGLGKELAYVFARNNINLLLCGRNNIALQDLKSAIESKHNISCLIFSGDLTDGKTLKDLISFAKNSNVDCLVNNAATLCMGKKITELSDEYIDNIVEINYKVPIKLIKDMYDELKSIVNINSLAALSPKKNRTLYCSTKSALKMFSETLTLETNKHVLDVYLSKLKKSPEDFGIDMSDVASNIYSSLIRSQRELLMDGR